MTWQVHAIRIATLPGRLACENFLGGDGANLTPMPVDYLAFALTGPGGPIVIDTGMDQARTEARGRVFTQPLDHALRAIGIDPATVPTVIQTHLHWDHAGGSHLFPQANFHLHARELAFVRGAARRFAIIAAGYEQADIDAIEALDRAGRLVVHDSTRVDLAPDLSLHHAGGHCDGLMVTRLMTARGTMCIAGDAVAHNANRTRRIPFPAVWHIGEALAAFELVESLADDPSLIIPGHDPWVITAHPAVGPGIARLA